MPKRPSTTRRTGGTGGREEIESRSSYLLGFLLYLLSSLWSALWFVLFVGLSVVRRIGSGLPSDP